MGIFPIYDSSMSRSVAKPSPAMAPSVATSIPDDGVPVSAGAVANAIRKLLQPAVRLAVKAGLKYADLDIIVRDALFREAQSQRATSGVNASQISMMTGLHRKDISARLAASSDEKIEDDATLRRSAASRVLFRWAHQIRRNPRLKTLSLTSKNQRAQSFARLTSEVVNDVHPRAVLDELIRLGFAREDDGAVTLLSMEFSPKRSADDRLGLFVQNAMAMLRTGVENVLGSRPAQLEYSIAMRHVSLADAERLSALAREHWETMREALHVAIVETPEVDSSEQTAYRFRVGTYVNFEEQS
jgi:Family of unknown function (DUF6502)